MKKSMMKGMGSIFVLSAILLGGVGGTGDMLPIKAHASGKNAIISNSSTHSLVLKKDGTVWAWGYNASGQLGNDTKTNQFTPVQVSNLTNVIAVTTGGTSSYALKSDGTVWAWGENGDGELGDGTSTDRDEPVQVKNISNVTAIASGDGHVLALKADGTVWSWGWNRYGKLGDGTEVDRSTPVQVFRMSNIEKIYAYGDSSFAIDKNGSLWTWGEHPYDGTEEAYPFIISEINNVKEVSIGLRHIVALKKDGTVWAWGVNDWGQLGNGEQGTNYPVKTPTMVQGLSNIVSIETTAFSSFALQSDGTLWTFGDARDYQLGDGVYHNYFELNLRPARVNISNVEMFTTEGDIYLAMKKDGSLWIWGPNDNGELGIGVPGTYFATTPERMDLTGVGVPSGDAIPPTITLSPSTTALTNQDVIVTVNASDASGIAVKKYAYGNQPISYFASNGTTLSGTSFNVSSNGVYTVYAKDTSGNESVQTITISNIDKVAPSVPTLVADKTSPTNQNVSVTINYPSDAYTKQYKLGSGSWTNYSSPVVLSQNETIYARAIDQAGNVSAENSLTVSNIDKTAPALATLVADKTTLTNSNVTVTINYPSESTVREYKIGVGGAWTRYSSPVSMTNNDTIFARSADEAGNVSAESSYVVNNIDKVAPVPATFTADKTTPTPTNVVVDIRFPDDAKVKEYKLGESGTWTPYTNPISVSDNVVVFARSHDEVGNISQESQFAVSNIDKIAPAKATLTPDKTTPTTGSVNIVIAFPADAVTREYKLDEPGTWTAYTAPVTVTKNSIVYARSKDEAGNTSEESTYAVTNIITEAPGEATFELDKTTATNEDVQVTITFPDTATLKEYKLGSSGAWKTYTAPIAVSSNTTLYARWKDDYGNLSQEFTYDVTNIDKIAPTSPSITVTDNMMSVSIGTDAESGVKETLVKVDSGQWTIYSSPVTLPEGEHDLYAKTVDRAGNESVIATKHVSVSNPGNGGGDEDLDNGKIPDKIGELNDPVSKSLLDDLLKAVLRAEANSDNRTLVKIAWDKAKAIPDSIRYNLATKAIFKNLYGRAEKLKNDFNDGISQEELELAIKKATDYVVSYEKYKIAYYKQKAQEAVNALPDGETKTALQARIDAVVMK